MRDPAVLIDSLRLRIINCDLCKLCQVRIHPVPGEGDPSAKLMIVGEAPGRREDELGRPFVGAAGKVLDQVLEIARIKRSEVFITNVVKCRPPSNRIPEEEECNVCVTNFLDHQIDIIQPRIICVMGRTAVHSLLGIKSILSNRGKFVFKNRRKYFLTIHPAATIYNFKLRSYLEEDFKVISRELDCQ